jgi:hypothetical protein
MFAEMVMNGYDIIEDRILLGLRTYVLPIFQDAYVLVSLIVVMMMACQNAILSFYQEDASRMKSFDIGSAWFFLAIYLLIQLICGALLGIAVSIAEEDTQPMSIILRHISYPTT